MATYVWSEVFCSIKINSFFCVETMQWRHTALEQEK